MRCDRCGKDNPADVHTCTPLALKLADELEMWTLGEPAAAELRRLYEEVEGTAQRNRDIYKQLDAAEAEIDRLTKLLRQNIRTYMVDDQHYAPEEEATRLLGLVLTGGKT